MHQIEWNDMISLNPPKAHNIWCCLSCIIWYNNDFLISIYWLFKEVFHFKYWNDDISLVNGEKKIHFALILQSCASCVIDFWKLKHMKSWES
jgi:hypothetical protein